MEPEEFYLLSETALQFLDNGHIKEEYSIKLSECPVCGGKKCKRIFAINGFDYHRCKSCSFVFVNPRLNDQGSQIWYNSQFYNTALEWEMFLNRENERYASVSLNARHFRKVAELIDENFKNKNTEIIDLGCSTGSLLSFLKNELHFTNLTGIDLNIEAVGFAKNRRKLNVNYADATKIIDDGNKYDLVISTENIEHVNDLEEYIKNISHLLKPKGQFVLSTPNNDNRAVRLMGKFGDHFCAPNHINYFNSETISLFLAKKGFEIKTIWLDEVRSISIYGVIKAKFFLPDQVITKPPYEAYFSRPVLGAVAKRRETVCLRLTTDEYRSDTIEIQNSHYEETNFLKRVLKKPLNIVTNNHMILIAGRKNEKGY